MLYLKILNEEHKQYLETYYNSDAPKGSLYSSGMDLVCPDDLVVPAKSLGFKIKLGIACQPDMSREVIPHGYYLYARSSISKTPLRLANNVGIIDYDYTGELMAKVDNHSDEDFKISKGDKLFQICMPHLQPFSFIVVEELEVTERGSGGFGSTGKNYRTV
jgi:dUTP pyrophosphatase